jgi:nitrate/TMAO reductase-like tetraheme cytochrome c subunit
VPEEGVFSGDLDNVMRWVSGAGILFGLASAGILIYVLVRSHDWRVSAAAKWTLLVGLFLLPAVTMLFGNVVGFHKVKTSCFECHTMDPWVADMRNPASKTLVSLHYKNRWIPDDQCYTCHTGYGLAGNVRAKIGGLGHVMHEYVTGVPEVIKIRRPFAVDTCLHCHGESAKYLKIDQHVDAEMKPKILSGEMSCFECHETPHPRKKP